MTEALAHFRDALAAFYREEALRVPAAGVALTRIAARLADPGLAQGRPERRPLAAMELVPAALGAAEAGPLARLSTAFAALEPEVAWTQNPNYSDARMGEGYMASYAYCVVAGPGGLLEADDVLVSLMVIGPGRLYPAHAHEAEEVYHLLAGPSLWWREGEPWVERAPGALVHHRPWQPHATRTGSGSLLAIASWHGDPGKSADLVPGAAVPAMPALWS